jgi:hypothetical protein
VLFKGEVLPGEQVSIIDRALFDAVQTRLTEQVNSHNTERMKSDALLIGRIFDDRGNRMSPSHARKGGIRYRYYLSSALLQGRAETAGSIRRVTAREIEAVIVRSIRERVKPTSPMDDRKLIDAHVVRVEVHADRLIIQLAQEAKPGRRKSKDKNTLTVPWRKTATTRRREILLPAGMVRQDTRPIRAESRALLVASIARGRRWLAELLADVNATAETIARRERCSVRKVNMTISLAFLAPDLVQAAVAGRLPRGIGVVRLVDMPAEWSRQHQMLGLPGNSP